MRPEPFFSGPGLDRADPLRADPQAIAELARSPQARQLEWREGLPAIGEDGLLVWRGVEAPDLFLGLDGDEPRFSAVPPAVEGSRAAFGTMGNLSPAQAPIFAAALSLGGWHGRHRFCANCGAQTGIVRGGW